MEKIKIIPFTLEAGLTGYMPLPRELLDMDLPSTAVLIYGALLDRATPGNRCSTSLMAVI